jgi:hypothetical protein
MKPPSRPSRAAAFAGARAVVLGIAATIGAAAAAQQQANPWQSSPQAQQAAPSAPRVMAPSSLVGRWLATGKTPDKQKLNVLQAFQFGQNGRLMMEEAVSSDKAGGLARCTGNYRYDGASLSTAYQSCMSCVGKQCMPFPNGAKMFSAAGPVQFQDQGGNAFRWGDLTYRRQ